MLSAFSCRVRFLVDADTVKESIVVYYTNTCYMQELYATAPLSSLTTTVL